MGVSQEQLAKFQQLIEITAKAEAIETYEVTRSTARRYYQKVELSERQIGDMGGFGYLREQHFPQPKGPLDIEDIDKWPRARVVDHICDIIHQTADNAGIEASEVTWDQWARFIKLRWGQNERHIPKYLITRAGGFYRIRDARFKIEPTESVVNKRRLTIEAGLNRKEANELADKQYVFEQHDAWTDKFVGMFKDYSPPQIMVDKTNKILHLVISDTHFGSDLDPNEVGVVFGAIEEARRMASVVKQFIEFAETPVKFRVKLWIIGDIFQGQLHDARDGCPLAEQMCRSEAILDQVVAILSHHFKSVDVYFATGNHGRNKVRHQKRAVHQKWDSLETPVYYHVTRACSSLKNVTFMLPKTPYVIAEAYGFKFFGTHGDTVINPGTPSKTIAVESMEYQSTKLSAAFPGGYAAFIFGHIHQFGHIIPGNKIPFISNPPLIPPDSFAWSIGVPDTLCGQSFFVSTPSRAVFYAGNLEVGVKDDCNTSLDTIIKPFRGL